MQEVKESKKSGNLSSMLLRNNIQLDSSGGVTLIIRNLEENEDGIFNSKSKSVGKTTTAVNLATALSISGKSCLVIDLGSSGKC